MKFSANEYAQLSKGAYKATTVEGWTIDHELSDKNHTTYIKNGHVVVAFSGTRLHNKDRVRSDLEADLAVALGTHQHHHRFHEGVNAVRRAQHKYGHHAVEATGHSLGGSIGMHASHKTGVPTAVFNPGVSPIVNYNGNNYGNVTSYSDANDPISNSSSNISSSTGITSNPNTAPVTTPSTPVQNISAATGITNKPWVNPDKNKSFWKTAGSAFGLFGKETGKEIQHHPLEVLKSIGEVGGAVVGAVTGADAIIGAIGGVGAAAAGGYAALDLGLDVAADAGLDAGANAAADAGTAAEDAFQDATSMHPNTTDVMDEQGTGVFQDAHTPLQEDAVANETPKERIARLDQLRARDASSYEESGMKWGGKTGQANWKAWYNQSYMNQAVTGINDVKKVAKDVATIAGILSIPIGVAFELHKKMEAHKLNPNQYPDPFQGSGRQGTQSSIPSGGVPAPNQIQTIPGVHGNPPTIRGGGNSSTYYAPQYDLTGGLSHTTSRHLLQNATHYHKRGHSKHHRRHSSLKA